MFMKPPKKGFSPDAINCQVLGEIASRFMDYSRSYVEYFNVHRRNQAGYAKKYLSGLLMKAPRKNMERMDEYVDGGTYQAYQNFISESTWNYLALNERLCSDVNEILGGPDSVLCIDESAFSKKGKNSVGVSRQWNGRLGKIDNCQVGVYASLCDGTSSSIIDYRLFVPQEWIDDTKRCEKAGIPEDKRIYRTKIELALEMVDTAISRGVSFGYVAADAFYGRDSKFQNALNKRGLVFVMDIPSCHTVYLEDPKPYLPRRRNKIGPKYKNLQSKIDPVKVSQLFEELSEDQWEKVTVRNTTKGTLKVNAYRTVVYAWGGKERQASRRWLVFLHDPLTNERKWFFSNADDTVSLNKLVERHASRYWIERTFQDGKTSVGMADYQVRGWVAWHHHMTMVMMALLFMTKERKLNQKDFDLLSCQDIVELLGFYLPRKDSTEKAVLENMLERHRRRRQSIESAYRRQRTVESIQTK
jgi:SRSO17 transposase